jgi:hypothetical protein
VLLPKADATHSQFQSPPIMWRSIDRSMSTPLPSLWHPSWMLCNNLPLPLFLILLSISSVMVALCGYANILSCRCAGHFNVIRRVQSPATVWIFLPYYISTTDTPKVIACVEPSSNGISLLLHFVHLHMIENAPRSK